MSKGITGGCLCGRVKFSLTHKFRAFYQCHCRQCQQLTGSAFAANLFTDLDNIEWISGSEEVTNYEHPTRAFSKSFCSACGSALPFINKARTALVIPAGSLNERLDLDPQANIFKSEEAHWFKIGLEAKSFSGFPE